MSHKAHYHVACFSDDAAATASLRPNMFLRQNDLWNTAAFELVQRLQKVNRNQRLCLDALDAARSAFQRLGNRR